MDDLQPWDDAAWWWLIGLQGVIGGLIAAALTAWITWMAVGRTLRSAQSEARSAELRSAVAELQASATRSVFLTPAGDENDKWARWIAELAHPLLHARALAEKEAPAFAQDLDRLNALIFAPEGHPNGSIDRDEARRGASMLTACCNGWLRSPDRYEDDPMLRRVEAMRQAESDEGEVNGPPPSPA